MFRFNPSLPSEIDSSFFSQGSRIGFSITLPLWRVMTNWTWSICWLLELLALELYYPLGFCCGWDGNLPFSWKLRVDVNFARVFLKSVMLWASWVLIVSYFSMNALKVILSNFTTSHNSQSDRWIELKFYVESPDMFSYLGSKLQVNQIREGIETRANRGWMNFVIYFLLTCGIRIWLGFFS